MLLHAGVAAERAAEERIQRCQYEAVHGQLKRDMERVWPIPLIAGLRRDGGRSEPWIGDKVLTHHANSKKLLGTEA